jgi:phosphoribosylanthranilate isomerase
MFRVKICGITSPEDALVAAESGADAIGLNFFADSPRYIAPQQAREIADQSPPGLLKIGVFVNASANEIRRVVDETRLDAVQLHGDEPPELVNELAGIAVVRALRLRSPAESVLPRVMPAHGHPTRIPKALLVDAYSADAYGGTGQTADWSMVQRIRREVPTAQIILAGGLTPENVGEAIRFAVPDGVDTASGVELSPGIKDPVKVADFVKTALAAFTAR